MVLDNIFPIVLLNVYIYNPTYNKKFYIGNGCTTGKKICYRPTPTKSAKQNFHFLIGFIEDADQSIDKGFARSGAIIFDMKKLYIVK